jgi:hypothetical protein
MALVEMRDEASVAHNRSSDRKIRFSEDRRNADRSLVKETLPLAPSRERRPSRHPAAAFPNVPPSSERRRPWRSQGT